MLKDLVINDIFKQKRTMLMIMVVAIPVCSSLLLFIDFILRYESYLFPLASQKGITSWQMLLKEQSLVFFKEYLPLFGAMILGSIFDNEYKNNGWTLALTQPVRRERIILSKFITSLIFMMITLLINLICLILIGKFMKFPENIDLVYFFKMLSIQFLAVMSVMTIHLFLTLKYKNTLISIGIAGVICITSSNLFFNGSSISNYNPYSFASFSSYVVPFSLKTIGIIALTLTISGIVFILRFFNKKESY